MRLSWNAFGCQLFFYFCLLGKTCCRREARVVGYLRHWEQKFLFSINVRLQPLSQAQTKEFGDQNIFEVATALQEALDLKVYKNTK